MSTASITLFWFDTFTLTAAATAVSLFDKVTSSSLTNPFAPGGGQVVSLNFVADKDLRIGFSTASVDDDEGGVLIAGTPFVDSATGVSGNTIPLANIFLYAPTGGGTVTVTCYIRCVG
jgi:hypothetical protein